MTDNVLNIFLECTVTQMGQIICVASLLPLTVIKESLVSHQCVTFQKKRSRIHSNLVQGRNYFTRKNLQFDLIPIIMQPKFSYYTYYSLYMY